MCGIIGYIGSDRAAPILLEGLKSIEYRGYDSAGMATLGDKSKILVKKGCGRIDEIDAKICFQDLPGSMGIAHTRWATHGNVSDHNAHPHLSCNNQIAVVHNGIIENHLELREELIAKGHRFLSQTDTEVIAHLIEDLASSSREIRYSIFQCVRSLRGSFAFLAIFNKEDFIVGARKDAPLAVGIGRRGNFLASDVVAFLKYTDQAIFLDNEELAFVGKDWIEVKTFRMKNVKKKTTQVAWEARDISKREFLHFTLKEIHEQASTVRLALQQDHQQLNRFIQAIKNADRILITGCGTSYHASLIAEHLLETRLGLQAKAVLSSEFNHNSKLTNNNTVVIAISQSGETADVLDAIRSAKEQGAEILSLVNSKNSSLSRESDICLSINCGPEIGVAATKSFTAQLTLISLLTRRLLQSNEIFKLEDLSSAVKKTLALETMVSQISRRYSHVHDIYFIGRGIHFPIALEGALKLKELAYIHAEGLAAGEIKHGTLALIDINTPVIVLNPRDETYNDTLSNAAEMKARGAKLVGISNINHSLYDHHLSIPTVSTTLLPIVEVIPLQMLAYYTAVARKQNPDYPRNLAKSVTVR